jgi:hypothetical protein
MKKMMLTAVMAFSFLSVSVVAQKKAQPASLPIKVAIDLNTVKDDKVMVTIMPPAITTSEVVFHIPKTVPGTYSTDNYGKLVDDFKAFDKSGKELTVTKILGKLLTLKPFPRLPIG